MQYRPYLIRQGQQKNVWDEVTNREWHGDPVIAILRSYAIAAGLQRLPVEQGGVPQEVADTYLELVGLYGTAAPVQTLGTITVEGTLGEDTIRVRHHQGVMGPPLVPERRSKRLAAMDDNSDSGSVASSNRTRQSDESALSEKPATTRSSGLTGVKRPASSDNESEIGSADASERTGRSNDTQSTRAVGPRRTSKKPRLETDKPVSYVPGWAANVARTRR